VYSGEMMWDMLKSAVLKAGEEQGYSLRGTQCDKSTVTTKSVKSGKPFSGWTYSIGCYCSRIYQSRQASFMNSGGNDMFEQGNKVTLMKGNRKLNKEGHLERPCHEKRQALYLLMLKNEAIPVSGYIISSRTYIITFQPTEIYITFTRVLLVLTTIMNDKHLCLAAVRTWTSTLRKW
jgi:hypothetical protein